MFVGCSEMFFGSPIGLFKATLIAKEYLAEREASDDVARLQLTYECKVLMANEKDSVTLYYVFNRIPDRGFIVVSADDRIMPVLGYTSSGACPRFNVPDGLELWFDAIRYTIKRNILSSEGDPFVVIPSPRIEPLIKTRWGQLQPYNLKCPFDSVHNDGTMSGCIAVSMAQIMNYYRWPEKGRDSIRYLTRSHKINMSANMSDFVFDWDNMSERYRFRRKQLIGPKENAVASLMYACGLASKMDYCTKRSISGIDLQTVALRNNFDYNPNLNIKTSLDCTPTEWFGLLYNDLSDGHPIIMSYANRKSGHNFICDGYDGNGLFHVNWGWEGLYDGYFVLSSLQLSPKDRFVLLQSAICQIYPKNKPVKKEKLYHKNIVLLDSVYVRDRIKFQLEGIKCDRQVDNDGQQVILIVGLGLGEKGKLIYQHTESFALPYNHFYSKDFEFSIPKMIPDGDYQMYLVYKKPGKCSFFISDHLEKTTTQACFNVRISGMNVTLHPLFNRK